MRKRYQTKRHSCRLCKPHRVGREKRHTGRELQLLRLSEVEIRERTG